MNPSEGLGRNPEPEEVAGRLQIDIDQYWAAIDRVKPVSLVSIDGVLQDEEGREGRALVDTLTTAAHETLAQPRCDRGQASPQGCGESTA